MTYKNIDRTKAFLKLNKQILGFNASLTISFE